MATIYKKNKVRKGEPYWIQYLDHTGKRRTVKGFTDKGLTEQLAAKLENDALLRKTGLIDPVQERLAQNQQLEITGLIKLFGESIAEKSPDYKRHALSRLRRIVTGCRFKALGEIQAEPVEVFLKALRKKENLGPRTYNHYLQAADAFCNWCVETKRLVGNPLIGIERLNVELDIRHQRRALTAEEVALLVQSARESGVQIQRFTGEQRARVYLLSYMTGLRRRELGSLTPRSFDLKSEEPTLTVEARMSKRRKRDVLPLHPDLVAMLKEWIPGIKPSQKLFPKLERRKTWHMVKLDLERVGLKYETEEGIADFHAAGRHSHITELLRNGASLPEAQKLARHSDIKMTMKYTHIGLGDQARAVAKLPTPALQMRCISGVPEGHSVATPGNGSEAKERRNPCRGKGFGNECRPLSIHDKLEAGGIEPPSCDPSDKASTCVDCRLSFASAGSANKARLWLVHHVSRSARSGH